MEKLNALAEKYPGSRLLFVRKTRASLTTTGLVTFSKLVLPPGNADVNYQRALYPNGSEIIFGGMDKSSKVMSSEYDVAYVQEATELSEGDWEDITTRLRWGHIPYQQILADCNPSYPKHWLKQRANLGKCVMLESRHEDNPSLWTGTDWTEGGRAYIAKLDALSGARYLRLRKGIWAAAEGMVYEDYDAAVHLIDRSTVIDNPDFRNWPRIWVVDFGFTNPFCWQAWARDRDGRLYRYREIYQTQRLVEDHAREILRVTEGEPRPIAVICDHDAEDRATLERYLGMLTGGAYKAITPGIQAVQRRLKLAADKRARIFFLRDSLVERDQALVEAHLPTCSEEEIESYVWPSNVNTRHGEHPVDKDNHGMDTMRYSVAFWDSLSIEPERQDGTFGISNRRVISQF